MSEVITVSSNIEDIVWSMGESVVVASGVTITNAELTFMAESLTLAAGSTISGTLTVANEVTLQGTVNASNADIVWDISHRQQEEECRC